MAKGPDDLVMPMLREMGAEMHEQFSAIGARLDRLEASQKTIRQALTADTMMSKFVTGDFEERITDLELKVDTLLKTK
jgi:hypothetical protein